MNRKELAIPLFEDAIEKIRETPSGKEASMYGPLRDLFTGVLGYEPNSVDIDTSGEAGRPDLTVRAPSGLTLTKGAASTIPWIVVEVKDERGIFRDPSSREDIFAEKAKYITPDTGWFFMAEPEIFVARPTRTAEVLAINDIEFPLDGAATKDAFLETFIQLRAETAGVPEQIKRFRDGDESLIATEKLQTPKNASPKIRNQVRLARRHFFTALRETTALLQKTCEQALNSVRPTIDSIHADVATFSEKYGEYTFESHPISIRGRPKNDQERKSHARDAAALRRRLVRHPTIARLTLVDLKGFRRRTGLKNEEELLELFAIETANLILARILLVRFFEDHGFFGEKKYVCNGGVAAFQNVKEYFDFGYTRLLGDAYQTASRLNVSAFEETELEWIFDAEDDQLSRSIEWAMYQLSRYDFRTVRGDILTGIYDRFLDRSQRKRLGEFYTPPSIARYVVDRLEIGPNSRVLDPACGSGTFLIEAYQRAIGEDAERGVIEYKEVLAFLERIAGNDINTFSAVIAQIQMLWHLMIFQHDLKTAGFPTLPITERANSLRIPQLEMDYGRFGEIDQPVYDAVVGNPPFVRPERIDEHLDKASIDFYSECGISRSNLYAAFVYRALKTWCRDASEGAPGKLGFVLPLSFCGIEQVAGLRRLFLPGGSWKITEIVDLELIWRYVFDGDVLPILLFASNVPADPNDEVVIRVADKSCLDFGEGDARPAFRLHDLDRHIIKYEDLFTPDGRILTRVGPDRAKIVAKLRACGTFEDIAKPFWVKQRRAFGAEYRDTEPEGPDAKRWQRRLMIAGGLAFRGKKGRVGDGSGLRVYKGENIVGTQIQGEPQDEDIDADSVDDASLWRYSDILPAKVFAFPVISVCPSAVSFDPSKVAFTNTATLLAPRDELASFPFDLLVLSRVYSWYYVLCLRMSYLNLLRSHLYPTNLRLLPWSPALEGIGEGLEAQRAPLLDACEGAFKASQALMGELGKLSLIPLKKAVRATPGGWIRLSESLSQPNHEVRVSSSEPAEGEEGWKVGLSPELFDWIELSHRHLAERASMALAVGEGLLMRRTDILNLRVPKDSATAQRYLEVISEFEGRDPDSEVKGVLDKVDSLVGAALGLSEADISHIQREARDDPFLSRVRPRLPYSETRKHGYRTGLERSQRYE